MHKYKILTKFFIILVAVLPVMRVEADETMSYERNFDIRIGQKPAPILPAVDLLEEKILFDSLKNELRKPIHPLLGPEIKPDASE